jgi:prephenate dehydrogenase
MDIIATCNNGDKLTPEDFGKLRLIPEFMAVTDVSSKFKREIENLNFSNQVKTIRREYAKVYEIYNTILSAEKNSPKDVIAFIKDARKVASEFEKLIKRLNNVVATDQASALKAEFENEAKQCLASLASEVDRLMEKK